jgi:hypothetical protein
LRSIFDEFNVSWDSILEVEETPMLHKQYGKKYLIICYYIQYRSVCTIFWKSHLVNSKDALILAYCLPFGKAGELQILRCQGIAVNNYNFTLDAWTLKPSDFCNDRGNAP